MEDIDELIESMQTVRDSLNDELIKLYNGALKNDVGILNMKNDPLQIMSFSRGKSIGLIIARDRITTAIAKWKSR